MIYRYNTGILLLIGLISRGKWFCSSHDLLNTFVNETAYCTFSGILLITSLIQVPYSPNFQNCIQKLHVMGMGLQGDDSEANFSLQIATSYRYNYTGIVFTYILAQIGLWIFFHSLGLFWSVAFPLHLRKFRAEKKLKYVHVTTVLVTLFLPLVPALLHLIRGYSLGNTPTVVCLGRSIAVTFYSFILPLSIVSAIVTSLLVILFWIIFKVYMAIF